jgi:WD40 repeat protein
LRARAFASARSDVGIAETSPTDEGAHARATQPAASISQVRLWDAVTRKLMGEPLWVQGGHSVLSASFSPEGSRIVTASSDGMARIWDAASGKPIGEPLKAHNEPMWSAAFSSDGKRVVTASDDTTAQIWDAGTGKPIESPRSLPQETVNESGEKDAGGARGF